MTKIGVRLALVALIVATVGCDRVTKHMAVAALAGTTPRSFLADTVRLEYSENTGGFLSLGARLPVAARTGLFTIGTGLALVGLTVLAIRLRRRVWTLIGLSLFLAGGASNWWDRAATGRVVDFMNVGVGTLRTGIFNVADVAIWCGAAVFVLAEIRGGAAE